jgi:AcrR family transcriptional regulator
MVSPTLVNRQKLLEAAARVFAEVGFRGATTRRIAEEAGVNEVTLFRLFGSKAQLMSEAIECVHSDPHVVLPEEPGDVEAELTDYFRASLEFMRRIRFMIRKTMAELEERPEMAAFVSEQRTPQFQELVAYAAKVRPPATPEEEDDLRTACTMLMAAIFSDAVGREIVPTMYPTPASEAASKYVRVFLKMVDVRQEGGSAARVAARNGIARSASSRQ